MNSKSKTQMITIRASEEDRQRLKDMSAKFGMSQGALLRMVLQTERVELTIHPAEQVGLAKGLPGGKAAAVAE